MNKLTTSMVRHAHAVAREVGAKAVMFDIDTLESREELETVIKDIDYQIVLVTRSTDDLPPLPEAFVCKTLKVPKVPLTRVAQIKIAVLIGVAEKTFERNDLLICLSGDQQSGSLDMMVAVKVGEDAEFFLADETHPLPPDVQPAVFEHVLRIVSEIAIEGREHRQLGALFVIGDSEAVLENSRQMVINPFHGYSEEERNILDGKMDETLKEFASIDGAFIIRGDGVILSSGRYLMPKVKPPELRSGLGSRHEAAAGITAVTDAVAITLSESTSTITIFNSGRTMTEIEKMHSGGDG